MKLDAAGTYALLFRSKAARLRVGALGEIALPEGCVVYVGSAFGPGGLAGRLRHHLRPVARPRWHLDYLRRALELRGAWIANGPRALEHAWAASFQGLPGACILRRGFGASDCGCASHLFFWRRTPARALVAQRLAAEAGVGEAHFSTAARLRARCGATRSVAQEEVLGARDDAEDRPVGPISATRRSRPSR